MSQPKQYPDIKTTADAIPQLYGYNTPEIARHDGWTKIGYTEQQVEKRINQQTHTADVIWELAWQGNAIFDDGSNERFTDKDFHAYLRKQGIQQEAGKDNEWFFITGQESKRRFWEFREDRGILRELSGVSPYTLREEQEAAVCSASEYMRSNPGSDFLWNAKPRFGKTLAVYDFIKRAGVKNALIVTNRPAIANSWYDDYEKFLGTESGYYFVSEVSALAARPLVVSRQQYEKSLRGKACCIEFVSLQDLKGSLYFGGKIDKLGEVQEAEWDVLVIDEAHEGVDTYKTDVAFDSIKRKFTLHLSGTPFKALANEKFPASAIFNWTYADEQERKREYEEKIAAHILEPGRNPYADLPRLTLYTYQMSEIIKEELSQGVEIDGKTEEYAFDLNEFFKVENGKFQYEPSVDKFLDALTCQKKYPFSTPELREELKHTFWLLNRVDSAKALAKKLKNHPVFSEYEIIVAAGDGKIDDDDETKKSFDKVMEAVKTKAKTITLSVGQLTTGITVPEWTAVLMLTSIKSPALYMQAAFRAQNPCLFKSGGKFKRKENAYVFDFDPARSLTVFEQFSTNLSPETAAGKGAAEKRRDCIRKLLNFFPVIGEDSEGALIELDPDDVLSIPRKIRSEEVVRRGFMSNFLFQNISGVFAAPPRVIELLEQIKPYKEPEPINMPDEPLPLGEDGEIYLDDSYVASRSADIFGDKIYDLEERIKQEADQYILNESADKGNEVAEKLKGLIFSQAEKAIAAGQEHYGNDMDKSAIKRIRKNLEDKINKTIDVKKGTHEKNLRILENERDIALRGRHETNAAPAAIEADYERKVKEETAIYQADLWEAFQNIVNEEAPRVIVREVETGKKEQEKKNIEDAIKDHLRGFTRTIPSFLMAYGNENTTLATFEANIPPEVFEELTSITVEDFRFLRDGGNYEEDGAMKHYEGHLFDPVVFDDSVQVFLKLKKRLANYFEEQSQTIFDYIPPQKNNQIFTHKNVVVRMVDMLEEENPGCFSDSGKTFIDLYMKSGLYIAEIVKRLYQNEKMQALFPDKNERLKHIFAHQVYGLAPTEIIYRIVESYLLGFDEEHLIADHNLRLLDAAPYAKAGTLEQELDKIFG